MPRGKKKSAGEGQGLLATIEAQYLAALKFSRDQIDKRIAALEGHLSDDAPSIKPNSAKPALSGGNKASGKKKPRNYDLLKAKITKPMTIIELLKALDMKPKQEGTLRQVFTNYPGLFKSDGKRPATYTLDTSR
jgi:hypothetical protein